jgi:hypothetical protein
MATGPEEWIAALRAAFGPGGDPAARAALLERLLASRLPAEREAGRARWRDWLAGQTADAGTVTPDAERFAALLPALLTGALDPAGADAAWLRQYLAQADAAQAEVAELQQLLAEERAARAAAPPDAAPPPFPAHDLTFLAAPPAEAAPPPAWPAVWAAPLPPDTAERGLLLRFGPHRPPLPRVAEAPIAYASQPDGPLPPLARAAWTPLLEQTLDLGGPPGRPGLIAVTVQAQPGDPGTCRLQVQVSGPGVAGRETAVRLTVEGAGGPWERTPDAQGLARLQVPLADLPGLIITIRLP